MNMNISIYSASHHLSPDADCVLFH